MMKPNHASLTAAALVAITVSQQAAQAAKFSPVKERGELVLFDPATHDMSAISNYTHGRHEGHDLKPVVKPVVKGGQKFLEFTYRGKRGTACSTFYYENVPQPDEGTRYTV